LTVSPSPSPTEVIPEPTPEPTETAWREVYTEFLLGIETNGYAHRSVNNPNPWGLTEPPLFLLFDFDRDGTPELILLTDDGAWGNAKVEVFAYADGEVKLLGKLNYTLRGSLYISAEPNFNALYSDTPHTWDRGEIYQYTVEGGVLIEKLISSYDSYGNHKLYKYTMTNNLNFYFYRITENNIRAAIDKFDSPKTTDWKEAYAEFLRGVETYGYEFRGSTIPGSYPLSPVFYLYDIDKDGIPELLLLTDDGAFNDERMEVYTFRDGEVKLLGELEFYQFGAIFGSADPAENALYSDVSYKGHYGDVYRYTITDGELHGRLAYIYNALHHPLFYHVYDEDGNITFKIEVDNPELDIDNTLVREIYPGSGSFRFYQITEDIINNAVYRFY
jgi:hypothetical protein